MGRLKRVDRPIAKEVSLPESLVEATDEILKDPVTGKPPYGAWGTLMQGLLQKWMAGEVVIPGFEVPEVDLEDLE